MHDTLGITYKARSEKKKMNPMNGDLRAEFE